MSSIDRRSRVSAIAGICIAATLALGACSGASSSSTEQGGVSAGADKAAAPQPAQDGSAAAAKAPAATPGDTQKLARTAQLRLGVTDLTASAAAVRGVALGVGGTVTAENVNLSPPAPDGGQPARTRSGFDAPAGATPTPSTVAPPPRGSGTITLAVPAAQLDAALDQLGRLGTVIQRASSSQDVTSTYVDTQSRIGTMRASIDRLRALMGQTTGIDQIVRLETELSQRQADLESLEAKLANLDKQVTMSTVVVTLMSAGAGAVTAPEETGFVAGLRSGWKAFTGFFVGLLTVVGAVLPFMPTLALVALPGFIWWRRRPRARRATGAFAGFGPAAPDPERGAVTEREGQVEAARRPAPAPAAPESTTSQATTSPTTGSPNTESSTTASPTTGSPTTESSTTESSTTASPTTGSPTTESSTPESPTTQSSTPESPTTAPSTPGAAGQTGRTQVGEAL